MEETTAAAPLLPPGAPPTPPTSHAKSGQEGMQERQELLDKKLSLERQLHELEQQMAGRGAENASHNDWTGVYVWCA